MSKHSLSNEGVIFYVPETNEYIHAYMRTGSWTSNQTPEVSVTVDMMQATVNPDYRLRKEILDLYPTAKTLRVKVTRTVEVLTEELNFNLPPETK